MRDGDVRAKDQSQATVKRPHAGKRR